MQTCSYDIDLADKIGILPAIYVSVIGNLIRLSDNDKIALNREQIKSITGMSIQLQESTEEFLKTSEIMSITKVLGKAVGKNYYVVDFNKLMAYNKHTFNAQIIQQPKQQVKPKKTSNKLNAIKESIINNKLVTNSILAQYLIDWVDSLSSVGKPITVGSVRVNIEQLMSDVSDDDDKIFVVKESIKNSWKDFSWAIDSLSRRNSSITNNFVSYSTIKSDGSDTVDEVF